MAHSIFDRVGIVIDSIREALQDHAKEDNAPFECVYEEGYAMGEAVGYASGVESSGPPPSVDALGHAAFESYLHCDVDSVADHGPIAPIPNSEEPWQVVFEIVAFPGQLDTSEKGINETETFFANGYHDGIDAGQHQAEQAAFQSALDDRLPDWGHSSLPPESTPQHPSIFDIPNVGYFEHPAEAASISIHHEAPQPDHHADATSHSAGGHDSSGSNDAGSGAGGGDN